jgi:hypothetical protein
VDKEPFSHRRDPPGLQHPHYSLKVGALTLGYVQELMQGRGDAWHGADATVYHMPELFSCSGTGHTITSSCAGGRHAVRSHGHEDELVTTITAEIAEFAEMCVASAGYAG